MDYQNFISVIKKRVDILSYERSLEVALTISKRLFFDYQAFFDVYQWGNPKYLLVAISICENLSTEKPSPQIIEELIDNVDKFR